jgi:hypothetical protein
MAARTRSFVSFFSYAVSGCSGSEGISDAGRVDSSRLSLEARGDVDSIVWIRTMVRPSRFSSEPILAARSAREGSQPCSRRKLLARRLNLAALPADAARPGVLAEGVDHGASNAPFGERLELDAASSSKR